MLITLIMMELRLGLACGKVNIIYIKNIILVRVIIFVTKLTCAYVYVCLFSSIVACFLPNKASIGALTEGCTSGFVCAKNFLFDRSLYA
jgi:hypothetical protein